MKLLLVAYFYPPCTDTGAQRPASMARHLSALGHEVTVLTTSAYGPAPEGPVRVVQTADAQRWRARRAGHETVASMYDADSYSGEPHIVSKVIVPEPLALAWAPFARRESLRLAGSERYDAVITSSPPESVHSIGRALQKRGVAWIADVRDAWTFEPLRPKFPTVFQRRLDERQERRLLGGADLVVCVSEPAADDLRRRGIANPILVSNGWDPELAGAEAESSGVELDPERTSLVYTGRFGSYGRDPTGFVEGLALLGSEDEEAAGRLEIVVAGPLTQGERSLFERDVSPVRIVLAGSLSRERALALQREADALLLIAQPARTQLLNYKLFEYLAAGSPILALAEGTEAGRVAARAGAEVVSADDPEAIAGALRRVARGELQPPAPDAVAAYTYPAPAKALAAAIAKIA
jgi:glycosyltransferase involved in cell wall biosynthesis